VSAPDRRFLSPDTLPRPFGYSHVVDAPASRIVHVSGQVPLDAAGNLVGEGDFAARRVRGHRAAVEIHAVAVK
jgi:enamine deaminase RidA (YjgF/YER057c/UK114 family)